MDNDGRVTTSFTHQSGIIGVMLCDSVAEYPHGHSSSSMQQVPFPLQIIPREAGPFSATTLCGQVPVFDLWHRLLYTLSLSGAHVGISQLVAFIW